MGYAYAVWEQDGGANDGLGRRLGSAREAPESQGDRDDGDRAHGEDCPPVASRLPTGGFLWLRQNFHNLDARVCNVVKTVAWILRQTAREEISDPLRRPPGERFPRGLPLEDLGEGVRDRLAEEGRTPGQRFEETATERPDVRPFVEGLAPRLLGAHVGSRSQDDSRLRRAPGHRRRLRLGTRRVRSAEHLRESEIEHLDLSLGRDLHVSGLEIAVDDAFVVSGFESLGHLSEEGQRLIEGNRPSRDSFGQSLAFDELHDEKVRARGLLESMEGRDVRMVQRREKARLALESGKTLGVVGEVLRQDLDGDVAAELRIARPVDDSHSSRTELLEDLVMGESRPDHVPTAAENTRYSSMTPAPTK